MAALGNLGECLMQSGQFEKALPVLERSLSVRRQSLPEDHLDLAHGDLICIIQCTLEIFHGW